MGTMEVISLDDTAEESSLFVIDETPIMEEVTNKDTSGKKRKAGQKKKNTKKGKMSRPKKDMPESKKGFVVMGGIIHDVEQNIKDDVDQNTKDDVERNPKQQQNLETIVIDDEESVIVLSDDEVGIIGGELSASVEKAQRQLHNYQIRPTHSRILEKEPKQDIPRKRLPFCPKAIGNAIKDDQEPLKPRKLRPVVIDGSNVAFGHGDSRRQFSSKGIQICVDYFLKRGHTVKVFVPQFRRRHNATLDTHILDKLEEDKILVYTPSRHVNGKNVVSYDDRMMVEYATQCGAVIVTRDNLRDLAAESEVYKQVINERLLMFTWADEDILLFPQDPLGRDGPTLNEFLTFPPEEEIELKNEKKISSDNKDMDLVKKSKT